MYNEITIIKFSEFGNKLSIMGSSLIGCVIRFCQVEDGHVIAPYKLLNYRFISIIIIIAEFVFFVHIHSPLIKIHAVTNFYRNHCFFLLKLRIIIP